MDRARSAIFTPTDGRKAPLTRRTLTMSETAETDIRRRLDRRFAAWSPGDGPETFEGCPMTRMLRRRPVRSAVLTWIAIWPLITALLLLGEPMLAALPVPLRTLVLTGILVPLMSFVVMPRLTRWANALLGDAAA